MTKSLRLCLLLVTLVVTAYYVVLHARVLRIAHPITQDEPGMVEIIRGGNPYTLAGVTSCANVYGPVFPAWARPFSAVISDPYLAARWAVTVALFAAMTVLAWTLRHAPAGKITLGAAVAIFYILNISSHSLAATPDLLGVALFLAALALSERDDWPGLIGGLLLGILAALTKPYFALGWLIVVTHQVFFRPPSRALAYIVFSGVAFMIVGSALAVFAPDYFLSTFAVHAHASHRSVHVFIGQASEFVLLAGGLLVLAFAARPLRRDLIFETGQPPIRPALGLWEWACLLAAVALGLSLGWHSGNYLVYYFHLLLGPLLVVAVRHAERWPRLGAGALIANLLVLGWLTPQQPHDDDGWTALAANVAVTRGPILADPLLEPFARTRKDVELFAHGHSSTILQAFDDGARDRPQVHAALMADVEAINTRIRDRAYAAIYLAYDDVGAASAWSYDRRHSLKTIFANYRTAGEIVIFPYNAPYWQRLHHGEFPYRITKWVPR